MSTLKQKIRKQLEVRPIVIGMCALALGILIIAPVSADVEAPTAFHWIALDDVTNRVIHPPDGFSSEHTGSPSGDAPGLPAGDAPGGAGHDNNGHGNNTDGVDSSNPGQGGGGPNGQQDPSCSGSTCIDDENGGSGNHGNNGRGRH